MVVKESSFLKNVLVLLSGTLLSQIIPFIFLPILQRFYFTPADFGLLAVFISICELFSNISCLKLEFAIVLQHSIRKAINLMVTAFKINGFMVLFSALIILFFGESLSEFYKEPKLKDYLWFVPLYVFLVGINDIMTYWFNRNKRFGVISSSKIAQTGTAELVKLLTGYLSFNYVGLFIGRISGFFFSGIFYVNRFIKQDQRKLKLIRNEDSLPLLKENKKYLIFTTPTVFLGSLINVVYLNLFMYHFGKDITGVLGVSMTYLSAGFGVISVSFSQVFFSRVSEIKDRDELLRIYVRFAKKLGLIALIPILFIYLLPTHWVTYLLNDEWEDLIVVARIMSLWLGVWFVSSSLSFIYIRLGKQKEMLFFDLLHLILIVLGFYISFWINSSFLSALWGYTISQIVFYLFAIFIALYYIKRFEVNN